MTTNGIRKPQFLAFQTLKQLCPKVLAQGQGYIVTRARDKIAILLYNYEHFNDMCQQQAVQRQQDQPLHSVSGPAPAVFPHPLSELTNRPVSGRWSLSSTGSTEAPMTVGQDGGAGGPKGSGPGSIPAGASEEQRAPVGSLRTAQDPARDAGIQRGFGALGVSAGADHVPVDGREDGSCFSGDGAAGGACFDRQSCRIINTGAIFESRRRTK